MTDFPKNWATTLKIGDNTYCNALQANRYTWGSLRWGEDFTDEDIAELIKENNGEFEVLFEGIIS